MTRGKRPEGSAIDGLAGRLVAAVVLLLVVAALTAMHWDDLFGPEESEKAAHDPVAACIEQRREEINAMIDENPSMEGQRDTLLARVAPMCEDMLGEEE